MKLSVPTTWEKLTWLYTIMLLVVITSIGWSLLHLWQHIAYEWDLFYEGDSGLFITVGRGITNGLVPYRDLFETKPPGIFLLIATSLFLTKSLILIRVLQIITILSVIPIVMTTVRLLQKENGNDVLRLCVGCLIGIIGALYLGVMGGQLYTESFGAFFALLYGVVLLKKKWNWQSMLVSGLLMIFSIGMKEQYLLTCLAVFLVMHEGKYFLKRFIIPLMIGSAIGAIAMVLLGYLQPYFSDYLPIVFGSYFNHIEPWWIGGLLWDTLIVHYIKFSWVLTIVVSILLILYAYGALPKGKWSTYVLNIALLIGIAAGSYILSMQEEEHLLQLGVVGVAFFALAIFIYQRYCKKYGFEFSVSRLLIRLFVLYIIFYNPAVTGQLLNHHWVLSFPVIIFLITKVFALQSQNEVKGKIYITTYALLFSLTAFTLSKQPYDQLLTKNATSEAETMELVARIDTVLDACNIDRWLQLSPISYYANAYTKQSPIGPNFFIFGMNEKLAKYKKIFSENMRNANFLVAESPVSLQTEDVQYIQDNFTENPPTCAGGISGYGNVIFLHRKS